MDETAGAVLDASALLAYLDWIAVDIGVTIRPIRP
jgi:hypothetical protein